MPITNSRLNREYRTIEEMVYLFCANRHTVTGRELCPECRELLNYAVMRLERCPFQDDKPTCANCPVHCYKPAMRERVREVMRYSGPRMLVRHPILAIWHILDGRRQVTLPAKKRGRTP